MDEVNITPVVPTDSNRLAASLRWAAVRDATRPTKLPQGVYIFECEGFIKVGIAVDPRRRLGAAQVGCPFEIRLVHFRLVDDARDVERKLHHKLANQGWHVRGEWFKVTPDVLAELTHD